MFGNRLKEIRNTKKLSQAKLAEMFNVSQQTIGSWEVNRTSPPPETIAQIAGMLQITTDYLLGISPNPDPLSPDTADLLEQIEELKSKLSQSQADNAEEEKIIKRLRQSIVEMTDLISQAQDALAAISKLKNENNV